MFFMILQKPLIWEKMWLFFSYGPKCSPPIRLQDSLNINISVSQEGINDIVDFLHGDNHKGKVASETTTLVAWLWPDMPLA